MNNNNIHYILYYKIYKNSIHTCTYRQTHTHTQSLTVTLTKEKKSHPHTHNLPLSLGTSPRSVLLNNMLQDPVQWFIEEQSSEERYLEHKVKNHWSITSIYNPKVPPTYCSGQDDGIEIEALDRQTSDIWRPSLTVWAFKLHLVFTQCSVHAVA